MEIVIAKPQSKNQMDEQVNDPYQDKYGFSEDEVCDMYRTFEEYNEIAMDPKKLAAVSQYAKEKQGEQKQIVNSIADIEAAAEKAMSKKGKSGKPYYAETPKTADDVEDVPQDNSDDGE